MNHRSMRYSQGLKCILSDLRIIKIMYFEDSEAPLDQDVPPANKLVLGVSMAVIMLFFAGLNSIIEAADTATVALMAPF